MILGELSADLGEVLLVVLLGGLICYGVCQWLTTPGTWTLSVTFSPPQRTQPVPLPVAVPRPKAKAAGRNRGGGGGN